MKYKNIMEERHEINRLKFKGKIIFIKAVDIHVA